jgi:Ribosomal protein L21
LESTIAGAIVEALIIDFIKDKKVLVFKKRRRQNSRRKYGHRQLLSKIQITKILSKGGKVISEIKADKIKLSTDENSDKKKVLKKQVIKKRAEKKTTVKAKGKK